MLQHAIQIALESTAKTVIVVLGAQAEQIKKVIKGTEAQVVLNTDWQEGMASSIRCGIHSLTETHPDIESTILMLCDQPYVTPTLLNKLITAHQATGKAILASSYDDTTGVPALFHKSIFPGLLQLKGDVGARAIIQQHRGNVEVVAFARGSIDIDTQEDFVDLQRFPDTTNL